MPPPIKKPLLKDHGLGPSLEKNRGGPGGCFVLIEEGGPLELPVQAQSQRVLGDSLVIIPGCPVGRKILGKLASQRRVVLKRRH